MRTTPEAFHPLRGHVQEGTEVVTKDGAVYALQRGMAGWFLVGKQSRLGPLASAHEVTAAVVALGDEK